jgi:hypothetical protein
VHPGKNEGHFQIQEAAILPCSIAKAEQLCSDDAPFSVLALGRPWYPFLRSPPLGSKKEPPSEKGRLFKVGQTFEVHHLP